MDGRWLLWKPVLRPIGTVGQFYCLYRPLTFCPKGEKKKKSDLLSGLRMPRLHLLFIGGLFCLFYPQAQPFES